MEACLLEAGLVRGRDFVRVELTPISQQLVVRRWTFFEHPDFNEIVWRAYRLCGLTDSTLDDWIARSKGHPQDELDEQA